MSYLILNFLANAQKSFINFIRIAIFIVMAWIGGLKAFQYEADGIVPFVINSPLMSYFYKNHEIVDNGKGKMVAEYTLHKNKEGEVVPKNIKWHEENGTYIFSYGLGVVICTIGIVTIAGIWNPRIGLLVWQSLHFRFLLQLQKLGCQIWEDLITDFRTCLGRED